MPSVVSRLQRKQPAKSHGTSITPRDPSIGCAPPRPAMHRPSSPSPPPTCQPAVDHRSPSPTPRVQVAAPVKRATRTKTVTPVEHKTPTKQGTRNQVKKEEEEGRRSTRSSGKAEYFVALEGAPEDQPKKRGQSATKPAAPASKTKRAAPASRKRFMDSSSEEEADESEDEVVVASPSKERASPAKKAKNAESHLPSPARSTASSSASTSSPSKRAASRSLLDDDDEYDMISSIPAATPPARKGATRITNLDLIPDSSPITSSSTALPSPKSTPQKRTLAAISPNKPKISSPLKKQARRAAVSDSEEETVEADEQENEPMLQAEVDQAEEAQAAEEDELILLPTPRKSISTTPTSTPTRPRLSSITPTRSSSRIQRLPASVADIANAPASLRNRLVGFHMEDEGYGLNAGEEEESEEDEDEQDEAELARRRREKGKGKAVEQDEDVEMSLMGGEVEPEVEQQLALPALPLSSVSPSTSSAYSSSPLHLHLTTALSVLSGARLPRPTLVKDATSTLPPKEVGVMNFPYLEGGYDEWERPLRGALEEVVRKGMGNAVMLLGPRGVGKTMIIDRTLSILGYVHGASSFATVKLSGLVHTTDRLALRSIAVQLQQQGYGGGEFEVDEGDYSSNSATMTTLLRLLEPSSSTSTSPDGTPSASTSTSSDPSKTSKPLVLIVDEFDLFAQHPRQSFLYCLLDIVQGNRRRGGVAVVGVSSRVDCLSLLEKRVRSRCQSHVLQVMPHNSLTAFTELGKRLMRADERAWELERGSGDEGKQWAVEWNEEVERFWAEKKVKEFFERVWMVGGNVPTELRSVLSHMLYTLDYRSRLPPPSSPIPRLTYDLLKPLLNSDKNRDPTLRTLSTIELTALIGCKHLSSSTSDRQTGFNFEMLFEQYAAHARRASASGGALGVGVKSYSKAAMREAFDALRHHELLLPRSTSSTSSSTSTAGLGGQVSIPSLSCLSPCARDPFRLYRFVPWAKDVDREVEMRGGEVPLGLRRWCKNWLD
ncbi:hypothetical protein JCM11641_007354 [Rhodosporidiobolus odoratus]